VLAGYYHRFVEGFLSIATPLTRLTHESTQPMVSAPVATPLTQPTRGRAQSVRGRPRGGDQSGGGHGRCYEFLARPEEVASDVVIRGIVLVCHKDALVIFDLGSTYSYVSSYICSLFGYAS